jgi:hypothetical protein
MARPLPGWRVLGLAALLSACAVPEQTAPPAPAPAARPAPRATAPTAPASPAARGLPPPATPKSIAQLRYQAAQRLVAANPDITYTGEVPQPLLAIPVLEIELNADGSVRRIEVMRQPSQARETTQMAIDAVHRAAPFGDVSRLPKPWKFPETFLFRDDRRFKPRMLDS